MKDIRLLIWLAHLGFSTALPLTGFTLLGIRLHSGLGWGLWTVWAGLILGLITALQAFRDSLKAMERTTDPTGKDNSPASIHEHK